ncbi:MAG: DNA cytosine methyltransferase [Deltaproteobacteria bacterium]|nr:DNA cytosine methyltransferase [Deltaproteobacteria bacterium]
MRAVDLFAGWGGFTEGATAAGARVVAAANHWRLAVDAHAANHPGVEHVCQDLRQADWSALPAHDLLLASPACQGHSEAGQPARSSDGRVRARHDGMRATAWAVVDCVEVCRPAAFIIENVVPFSRWELFGLWLEALRRLGYSVEPQVLLASRLGVPQRRHRLFIIGLRGEGRRVPRVEHERAERAFGPEVQWGAGRWRHWSKATAGARCRFAAARSRHGTRALSQHVTGHRGVGLHEPIRTITTKDQWVVLDGDHYRPLTIREVARGMGFPDRYRWPSTASRTDTIRGLGNAVPPPMAAAAVKATIGAVS